VAAEEALLVATAAGLTEDVGEYPRIPGQAVLERAAEAVDVDYPGSRPSRTLTHPSARDALIEHSRRARMVVTACEDLSIGGAVMVGSTTLAVATTLGVR
jgi:hypothetical protein